MLTNFHEDEAKKIQNGRLKKGHFPAGKRPFFKSAILNFFLLHPHEN